ncbi:MAG TPA: hypothetical protein VFQ37_01195, partial [Mycobacterium sp.]|nr:hypothetical protein [Mycobacterium sp.]
AHRRTGGAAEDPRGTGHTARRGDTRLTRAPAPTTWTFTSAEPTIDHPARTWVWVPGAAATLR